MALGPYPQRSNCQHHALVKTVARAHQWFYDLAAGRVQNMAELASREGTDKSYIARIISLAFLAPDINESIIAGQHPVDLTIGKLTKQIELPLCWTAQRQLLGYYSTNGTSKIADRENTGNKAEKTSKYNLSGPYKK